MEEKKYFLVLDDLFYNLLKTLKEDDIDPKVLTHQEVCNYGKKLEEFAKNNGINIILLLSRDRTYQFYRNNYGIVEDDEQGAIKIIKNITKEELIGKYRGYLPLDVLLLIEDKNFKKAIIDEFRHNHGIEDTPWTRMFINPYPHRY